VTRTEAVRRLRVAEAELAAAQAAGRSRDVAAYSIAVHVLAQLVDDDQPQAN